MKNTIKIFAFLTGAAMLSGCVSAQANLPEPHLEIAEMSEVREGYYLSANDDSYFVVEDGTVQLVDFDWEKYFREDDDLPEGIEKGTPEFEAYVDGAVKANSQRGEKRKFTPVKKVGFNGDFDKPSIILVTNIPPEELSLDGSEIVLTGISMPDENTLINVDVSYTYCGTTLPE